MSVINGMARGAYEKIAAKAASYQVLPTDLGALFTTTGASGAVTFTLPAFADIQTGWNARFFNTVDQNMIVAAATADADKMVAFNDVAADSIAFSTASEKIGAGVEVVYDGTKWLTFVFLGAETQTPTIAT